MKTMALRNMATGAIALERVRLAESLPDRLRGLLGRRALEEGEGMYFPECRMILYFFYANDD